MSRLAAAAKGQFYPTPHPVADLVAALIDAPAGATIYDPCAGTGEAVARIAAVAGLTAYGNELDAERAAQARVVLHACTTGPMECVRRDGSRFSVVFFNPPYDDQVGGGRMETKLLPFALGHLAQRGLFVGLVPLSVVTDPAFVIRLHGVCEIQGVAKFPGALYEPFQQVVIWAQKREAKTEGAWTVPQVMTRFGLDRAQWDKDAVEPLGMPAKRVTVPGRRGPVTLTNELPEPQAVLAIAAEQGATAGDQFRALTQGHGGCALPTFRPLLPLRRGHAAEMLAAGFLDGGEVDWEGRRYLVRGHARRIVTERVEETGERSEKVVRRERFATVVTLLDLVSGDVLTLDMERDRARYEAFLVAQAEALTNLVQARFPAIYDPAAGDAGGIIGATLDQVRAPGKLPGVDKEGLLPIQRHVATACAVSLRSGDKTVIAVGEMGTGKTTTGTATWAATEGERMVSGRAKAVVLCPAHLTKKWQREIERTLGAWRAQAVIAKTVSEVDAAMASDRPTVIILSREAAKIGAEWTHAAHCTHRRERRYNDEGDAVTETVPVVRCPDCGVVQREITADAETGATIAEHPYRWTVDKDGRRVPSFGKQRVSCAACRSPLWQTLPYKGDRRGPHRPGTSAHRLSTPAFGGGRMALGPYVAAMYARRYVLIADELHEYKGATTDQGQVLAVLAPNARKVIGLTGTLYGGKASTLFHLGYRLFDEFRHEFAHTDEAAFVHAYGLVETTEYRSKDEGTSHYGYRRRGEVRRKEIPGAQPAMIAKILPHCAFMELADLEVALPVYEELQVSAPVPVEVAGTLRQIEEFGGDAAALARKGDPTLLSSYLQLALGWPYRMEGAEEVTHKASGDLVFSTPGAAVPAGGWTLDQRIVRFAVDERRQGRRTLVYLQQMTKRDASDRLRTLMERTGLRVAVLRATVDPDEREAWVAARVAEGCDVLITNPALVQTGLDLIAFPNVVHFGVDFSTYRLRQSSRRSWRLGQTEPVKVVWFFYEGTEAHVAMPLLAKKLRAAQHVDGRLAEGLAASADDEDGDLISALMRQVMTGRIERGAGFPTLDIPEGEPEPIALPPAAEAVTPAPVTLAAGTWAGTGVQGCLFAA